MPSYPKNYPFYNWVPKPVGIIILFVFFLPILTVGGTYSVANTEMMSELGIIPSISSLPTSPLPLAWQHSALFCIGW